MKKTREFKLEDGTSIKATFGMMDIGRCRRKLQDVTLSTVDVLTALSEQGLLDEKGNMKDVNGLSDDLKEQLLTIENERMEGQFIVSSLGIMAANKSMTEDQAYDILDENPHLIKEIFDFYAERNAVYQKANDYDPIEEDKKTKEKKT